MKISNLFCFIKLGTILEGIINIMTLGNGSFIAWKIANKLGYESCGCEERKEIMNGWTCKEIRDWNKELKKIRNEK